MSRDERMKPCPFCGSPGEVRTHRVYELHPTGERGPEYEDEYLPCCERCDGMVEYWFTDEEAAIEAWNRRAEIE